MVQTTFLHFQRASIACLLRMDSTRVPSDNKRLRDDRAHDRRAYYYEQWQSTRAEIKQKHAEARSVANGGMLFSTQGKIEGLRRSFGLRGSFNKNPFGDYSAAAWW